MLLGLKTKMLSIVTINKNNYAGLEQTIASLKLVTKRDFQWVCIDGKSTDGSVLLAQRFAQASDVIVSEGDSGIYAAMNKGVIQAHGEQILFLNSGDILVPISSIEQLHLDAHIDLSLFGFQIRQQFRKPRPNFWRFWSMPTSHQSIIYLRSLLLAEPFDERYRFAADFEHYLRVCRRPIRIKRSSYILSINESYGSDAHLPKLLQEYREALLANGAPLWWANAVYRLKTHYLPRVLPK